MSAIPLNTSARRLVHTRRVECRGFERADGLFDIEGRMRDTKADDADLLFKTVPAGSPIHDMRIIVTIDEKLMIHRIDAYSDAAPSRFCAEINHAYRSLEGLSIGAGFMKEVKHRLSGSKGCTHLSELLGPIATTAIQTLMGWRKVTAAPSEANGAAHAAPPHPMTDTCHAWRADGEVVQFAARRKHESTQAEARTADAKCAAERS
ncbi:molybdopterin-guanine dinucleotide biosynthesis protein MobB [Paraburkholderia monticola]|uniref:Molybdopterin-guanine dinucleotide biosynthesis protein MobB n=1 Tax=Paraburkholderia monticola TaxID=1399968 RepID=A0A149PB20_9BURK|nr:DUF2889 domain-containing protein [Paraburkholderia monticola]KXU82213.1 molybdopterin-guanine dinucleotide biosynthesis protein MobB [Paraburkholderia monticola]